VSYPRVERAMSEVFTTRPELLGTFGMVSSTHWLASAAGMAALEAGGNAFDAAATAGFVLQVVEPNQNGPGGDMPAIFALADDPRPTVICGQGPAPAAASIDHFTDLGLDLVPGSGPLAAVIPGAVPAWLTLLRDHGRLTLRSILEPAIEYAQNGYPVGRLTSSTIGTVAELFADEWTSSAEVYLPKGKVPAHGERLTNSALAATYRRLLEEAEAVGSGREGQFDAALTGWSTGFVAEAIERFMSVPAMDSSGRRHTGVLTGADMAGWKPTYEQPAQLDWQGLTVCKTAAWGQGPVLLQQLAILDGMPLDPGAPEFVHTVVEVAKLAFADREAWYGDATEPPLKELLSTDYAAARRQLVGGQASLELRPGSPKGGQPRLPAFLEGPGRTATDDPTAGEPTTAANGRTRGDTVHVAVTDRWGNTIAAMPSGGWLQSSPVVPQLGFPLGSRLQMAWLEPGLPNSLTPGRRPRTTLSPTMVLRDGEPVLAFGSPGGDQQDQWQLSFMLHHVLGGADLQAAIDAPTFHTTHFPGSFYPRAANPGQVVVEDRLGADTIAALRKRGHDVVVSAPWSLGRMCAVARGGDQGWLRAAANPRGMQGYAVGR
jgi:gamma-glutamyltranspeptidase/glutathione hydrolase